MITVVLSVHLAELGRLDKRRLDLEVSGEVTQGALIDALEAAYPALKGTIRAPLTAIAPPLRPLFRL